VLKGPFTQFYKGSINPALGGFFSPFGGAKILYVAVVVWGRLGTRFLGITPFLGTWAKG